MKILFTGCTRKQYDPTAYKRAKVDRIDDCTIMHNALTQIGHDVTRRNVAWGEDLSEFDLIIVGIAAFGSSTAANIINALYVFTQDKPILILHEDWKIHHTMSSYRSAIMCDDEKFKKDLFKKWSSGSYFYEGVDNINFDINKIKPILQTIIDGKYPRLVPKFKWGDKKIIADILNIKDENDIYGIDLTPYVLEAENIQPLGPVKKEMKYMLATLADHRPWVKKLKLKYDVDYFGCKSLKAEILKSEYAVYEKSNSYYGVLCPKYNQSGSGWFRMRYIYAAYNKNLIVMDEKDAAAIGIESKKLEDFDNIHDLEKYIELQSVAILAHMTDKEDFNNAIGNAVLQALSYKFKS